MKMSSVQRWLVWTSSILTFFTGVVYWWMKNGMEPVDAWAVINHPLQPWMLKAHILVAPVAVFAVGFVAGHYRRGRSQLLVSRGTGYWGPPFRLGTTSEITVLKLTKQ